MTTLLVPQPLLELPLHGSIEQPTFPSRMHRSRCAEPIARNPSAKIATKVATETQTHRMVLTLPPSTNPSDPGPSDIRPAASAQVLLQAVWLAQLGRSAEAVARAEECLQLDPKNPTARMVPAGVPRGRSLSPSPNHAP
jgi:hypothetical protein